MRTILLSLITLLTACPFAAAATKISVALNWVPEPEFGGIYSAKQSGAFAKQNLDVTITPGGAGAPTWQLVAGGKSDFAIASADEVIVARAQKADVVAIMTTYQTCPQGIMTHAARGLKNLSALFAAGGKLAVEPGLPYVNYFKSKYDLSKIELVTYDGGLGTFLNDKNFSQQCFVTSEPIAAKKAGADPQVFLIADSGYNPYTGVVITSEKYLREHPDVCDRLVSALKDGWASYLADPSAANAVMEKLNPDMDSDTFAAAAAAQKPLIQNEETTKVGLGAMTLARWQQLINQLVELKVVDKADAADAKSCAPTTK